mmetsp:Transcript_130303/g.225293  ORF Transcript_130303/g.225293 Transcript_130303/m.225293 type:complete len:294 (-) Transcript_130303:428-1309(-)
MEPLGASAGDVHAAVREHLDGGDLEDAAQVGIPAVRRGGTHAKPLRGLPRPADHEPVPGLKNVQGTADARDGDHTDEDGELVEVLGLLLLPQLLLPLPEFIGEVGLHERLEDGVRLLVGRNVPVGQAAAAEGAVLVVVQRAAQAWPAEGVAAAKTDRVAEDVHTDGALQPREAGLQVQIRGLGGGPGRREVDRVRIPPGGSAELLRKDCQARLELQPCGVRVRKQSAEPSGEPVGPLHGRDGPCTDVAHHQRLNRRWGAVPTEVGLALEEVALVQSAVGLLGKRKAAQGPCHI